MIELRWLVKRGMDYVKPVLQYRDEFNGMSEWKTVPIVVLKDVTATVGTMEYPVPDKLQSKMVSHVTGGEKNV